MAEADTELTTIPSASGAESVVTGDHDNAVHIPAESDDSHAVASPGQDSTLPDQAARFSRLHLPSCYWPNLAPAWRWLKNHRASIMSGLFGAILTLALGVAGIVPTWRGQQEARLDRALSRWTALKDFREYCLQENGEKVPNFADCAAVIQAGLPPPPHVELSTKTPQVLRRGSNIFILLPDSPVRQSMRLFFLITIPCMLVTAGLFWYSWRRRPGRTRRFEGQMLQAMPKDQEDELELSIFLGHRGASPSAVSDISSLCAERQNDFDNDWSSTYFAHMGPSSRTPSEDGSSISSLSMGASETRALFVEQNYTLRLGSDEEGTEVANESNKESIS